jgi:hypothetical protein
LELVDANRTLLVPVESGGFQLGRAMRTMVLQLQNPTAVLDGVGRSMGVGVRCIAGLELQEDGTHEEEREKSRQGGPGLLKHF